jgi:hypothetical protein
MTFACNWRTHTGAVSNQHIANMQRDWFHEPSGFRMQQHHNPFLPQGSRSACPCCVTAYAGTRKPQGLRPGQAAACPERLGKCGFLRNPASLSSLSTRKRWKGSGKAGQTFRRCQCHMLTFQCTHWYSLLTASVTCSLQVTMLPASRYSNGSGTGRTTRQFNTPTRTVPEQVSLYCSYHVFIDLTI